VDDTFHVSAKGVLCQDDRILLIQYREPAESEYHYNLPGGRIRRNEAAPDACKRKMLEEAGAAVSVKDFLFCYEYIGAHHSNAGGDKHSISLVFLCELDPGSRPSILNCTKPDSIQTDVCWVCLGDLTGIVLYPSCQQRLVEVLRRPALEQNRYFGDIF
jgi:8-oxo-dGTP diphosphatase